MASQFEMKFDPSTIEHLGVKMYSTLPPALAELVSNAYDADAAVVRLKFSEINGRPTAISISDNGDGMSSDDIQDKFLVIGRNRRKQEGDGPTGKFGRLATGKKGLGKLALFGLAKVITVDTVQDGRRNRFKLDWDALMNANGTYNPQSEINGEVTDRADGTSITLSKLKRQTSFDIEAIADSLSKIFIVDKNFEIRLEDSSGRKAFVNDERRYANFNKEFQWSLEDVACEGGFAGLVSGMFYTAETPIKPNSGLRGVSIFSRGKLVNAPEFFSNSTSSHFFQYLTGWIRADFIDLLPEDVISTNRQSINWDNDEMQRFRLFLSDVISRVNSSWRAKRKEKKEEEIIVRTGIDTEKWMATMPADVREQTGKILESLSSEEGMAKISPVIEALHKIVPEYPQLHWRYLDEGLRERVRKYYENQQYGDAADQGARIYCETLRNITGLVVDGTELTGKCFGGASPKIVVADQSTETGRNLQVGQEALSRGLISGFRNPISHAPIDTLVPKLFSEIDCLNILSLTSYLLVRLKTD